jgi:hypothetical protein
MKRLEYWKTRRHMRHHSHYDEAMRYLAMSVFMRREAREATSPSRKEAILSAAQNARDLARYHYRLVV